MNATLPKSDDILTTASLSPIEKAIVKAAGEGARAASIAYIQVRILKHEFFGQILDKPIFREYVRNYFCLNFSFLSQIYCPKAKV